MPVGAPGIAPSEVNHNLRAILIASGYNPDASPFPGLYGPVFNIGSPSGVDDTTTIAAKLAAAGAVASGGAVGATVVYSGAFITNAQIIVPNKVRLVGMGRSASLIRAGASFPINTPVVRLGNGLSLVFGCRLEDMTIDCNGIAGVTGVYSTDINEQSGCRNVLVTKYQAYGINIEESGAQIPDHFCIDDCELSAAASAVGTDGLRYSGLRSGGQVRRLTVNPDALAVDQGAGVRVIGTGAAGAKLKIDGLNAERHADALLFDTNAGGTAEDVALHTSGTNVVRITAANVGVVLTNLYRAAGTNTVKNDVISQSITTARVPLYVAGASAEGYQVFYSAGTSVNTGNVVSDSQARFTVKSTPTSGAASRCSYDLLDGNNDGWRIRFGADGAGDPLQFLPINAGVVGSQVFSLLDTGLLRDLQTANGPVGSFTLANAATTTVNNTGVTASSKIFLIPTNAAAATLMSGAKSLYISARSAGASFQVATADATAAAGTENFDYLVLN